MRFRTFTSGLIVPEDGKTISLKGINVEQEERGVIEGTVYLPENTHSNPVYAVDALVSLYCSSQSRGYCSLYHTYSDVEGRFLFPVLDTQMQYMIKINYHPISKKENYRPYDSKPFRVPKGDVWVVDCILEADQRKMLTGTVLDAFHQGRKNAQVDLYLTTGPNKTLIVQMGRSYTDIKGNFNFFIDPEGNYCIKIHI